MGCHVKNQKSGRCVRRDVYMARKPTDFADEAEKIKISNLTAKHISKKIMISGQIVGEKSRKAIPRKIKVSCSKCESEEVFDILDAGHEAVQHILEQNKLPFYWLASKFNNAFDSCEDDKGHKLHFDKKEYMDLSIIYIHELIDKNSKFDQRDYNSIKIYVLNVLLPKTKKITLVGTAIVEYKTQDICILAYEIESYESDSINFKLNKEDIENFKKYFFNPLPDLDDKQIAPHIVGRELSKKWIMRLLHSPVVITDIDGQTTRGGLMIVFIGDSKTGKSESLKFYTNLGLGPSLGEVFSMETGNRQGLLYTINNETRTLIWGRLPSNDLGLILLEGMQKMSKDQIGEFREVLNNQLVSVRRSVSGDALARVRILAGMNPNNTMDSYFYPCECITDTWIFKEQADITRWDIFLTFCNDDVSSEEIANAVDKEKPIPEEIFYRHVLWIWSLQEKDIEYELDAKEEIIRQTKALLNDYSCPSILIVHNGIRKTICRVSVAEAAYRTSTDEDFKKIIVKKEHVIDAINLYRETLDLIKLGEYAKAESMNMDLTEEAYTEIVTNLDTNEYKVLFSVRSRGKSSKIIAAELKVSDRTIKTYYEKLKRYELISSQTGKGIKITKKGIRFLRTLNKNNSEIVKENFTKGNKDEVNLHHFTKKKEIDDFELSSKDIRITLKSQLTQKGEISINDYLADLPTIIHPLVYEIIDTWIKHGEIMYKPGSKDVILIP
jgi:DNA-binding NarL/FixJ family response regulator